MSSKLQARRAAYLFLSVSTFATQAFAPQASATEPCFGNRVPTAAANAAAAAAAVSVAAADTSTNQILQVLQQRREAQSQSCPSGYMLVGTSCEPLETVSDEPAYEPPAAEEAAASGSGSSGGSASGGGGGGGGGSQAAGASKPKPKPVPAASSQGGTVGSFKDAGYSEPPIGKARTWGSWAEGYLDYEELGDLTINGVGGVTQKQTTSGYNAGTDVSFAAQGGGRIVIGGLGGAMRIKQDFSTVRRSGNLPTEFSLEGDPNDNGLPFLPTADITIDLPRTMLEDIEQEQRGQSLGLYGSYINNGWFLDGLFRVDRMTLEQTTILTDTRVTTIQGLRFSNDVDPRGNGNSCFVDNNLANGEVQVRPNFDGGSQVPVFGDPVTVREVRRDEVDFENYNFAARIGRRIDIDTERGTWWEPSANVTYLFSNFGSDGARLGFDDGHLLTLQGGARWGITQFNEQGGYFWTIAAGAYAFSDVLIDGFSAAGFGPAAFESEEGRVRALGSLQFNATWLNGVTWYAEGQVRAGEELFGVGGKVGGRIEW